MFKEIKGIEYTLETLKVLAKYGGEQDSRTIFRHVEAEGKLESVSLSYIQKVLPKMAKSGLIVSSGMGYSLQRRLNTITVDKILSICDMPAESDPLHGFCQRLMGIISDVYINEIYEFQDSTC
jgi:DNA-binding IscR family transcriptional regulator